jgi:hypothetical protein
VYHKGYKVFISVPFDQIKKYFPKAVWTSHGRNFVLLKHLPKILVEHLVYFRTPMADMSRYLPD